MVHGGQDGRGTTSGPSAAVIAAGLVVLLSTAALVLRPGHGLLHSGKGALGDRGIVVVALVAAWTLGFTLCTRRLRTRIGANRTTPSPAGERLRQVALPLLLAGPLLLGILALVLHRFTRHSSPAEQPPPPPSLAPMTGGAQGGPAGSGNSTPWPLYLLLGVIALIAAAGLVVMLVVLVRRRLRRGLTLPEPGAGPAADETDQDRTLLLSAVGSGRRALTEGGDARAAVIACYAAMEEALAASGVDRRASDSPADLLTRAARAGLAAGPAAPRLTALFREARYSSHPMDETRREAAATALEEIAAQLDDREAAG
ncbi:DUF4129 domain-containing protein [Streptomyces kunmingensis]|uniref:DUF4129 domain-containing protein n=1 Tax=Streptomyces kunmingensis TaxID=68225 RepID=A0ABU6CBF8_9ACTN|nr:DUF4129 domain-containing protein [Streptomyces kunmingensis]MEB3962039.1 DUF4129 domain-containing protein [Streptomyces kunmingensis]